MLLGRTFPRKAFLLSFVEACGVPPDAARQWAQAWDRLAIQHLDQAPETELEQLRRQLKELRERVASAEQRAQAAEAHADKAQARLNDYRKLLLQSGQEPQVPNNNTDEVEAWTSGTAATAPAVVQPKDALRTAMATPGVAWRTSALVEVAKVIAASDPKRAARLIADAEHAAQSITNTGARESALLEIAKVLATSDPGRAEQLVLSITDERWQASALLEIAKVLATSDPGRAEQLVRSITDERWSRCSGG